MLDLLVVLVVLGVLGGSQGPRREPVVDQTPELQEQSEQTAPFSPALGPQGLEAVQKAAPEVRQACVSLFSLGPQGLEDVASASVPALPVAGPSRR